MLRYNKLHTLFFWYSVTRFFKLFVFYKLINKTQKLSGTLGDTRKETKEQLARQRSCAVQQLQHKIQGRSRLGCQKYQD